MCHTSDAFLLIPVIGNTNQIAIKSSPEQPQSGLGLWVSAHPSINKLEAQLREIECERDSWKDLAKKYQDERCRAVAEVERYKEQATSYKKTPSYQPSPKTVALRRYWSHRKAQQPNPPTRTPHFPGLVSKPSGQQTTTTARPTQTLKREAERASPSILPSSGPMRVSAQQAAATGSGQTIKREAELPNPNISTIPGLKREHPDELGPFKRRKIELATDGKKDQGQGLGTASCKSLKLLIPGESLTSSGPVCID